MVSNLLKRVGFVGLAALMLSGTLMDILVFKQSAKAADPYNWVDGSGAKIDGKSVDWTKRLKFLSPFDIYDSATKTTYTTKNKIFGSGSSNLIREGDGYYVYLPTGKSSNYIAPDNNNCYGVFIWYITGKNTYSHLEIVQPEISSGKSGCSIKGKSISDSANTSINPNGSEYRIINDENGDWNKYKGIADWLVAPMYWSSKEQVAYFNSSYSLTKVTQGDSTYDNITKLLDSKINDMKSPGNTGFEYWKMGKCNNEYLVTELIGTRVSEYGYIMHFNGDPVKGDGTSSGTEYYDIGGNGGSDCMTGRNITGPSYDVINYGGFPAGKKNQVPISYAPQINDPANNPAITAPVATTPAGDGGVLKESCYTSGGVFAFIICPILDGIDKLTSWAEGVIANQLDVDLGSKEDRAFLEATWLQMARIASVLLVIIALVMVTSTALGFGLFNAYTVKKVMPRLVIGAVAIWFSWALVTYYIDFINILGKELASIMLSQFGEDAKNFSLTTIAAAAMKEGGDGSSALFAGLSIVAIGSVGWIGVAGLALTAGLAFVTAIATLAVRKAVIIFLVILAPLAIAAWILPNTQSAWKKWSSTLNKLLLMYPMIMGLIAAGKIFALVSARTATEAEKGTIDNFFGIAIALIAYVGPLFMIPGLIKSSGNIMSKVSGGVGKLGGRATGGLQNSIKARADAKSKFRKQLATERLAQQAGSAGMMGSAARARLRFRGGQPLTGKATGAFGAQRKGMIEGRSEAAMYGAVDAVEQQQAKEAAVLIEGRARAAVEAANARNISAGGTGLSSDEIRNVRQDFFRSQVTNTSNPSPVRQAALDTMLKSGDISGIDAVRSSLGAQDWSKFTSRNFGDLKDKAPDLVGKNLGEISAEAVSKMHATRQETWRNGVVQSIVSATRDPGDTAGMMQMLKQMNGLSDPAIQRTLPPGFMDSLYSTLNSNPISSSHLGDIQSVLESGGRMYFADDGTVRSR